MVVSVLLYRCTPWTLTKCIEKKLDRNAQECYVRFWTNPGINIPQNSCCKVTNLFISETIQIRRTRHAGYCCRNKGELISNVLLWIPSHKWTGVGRPASTYLKQLCTDTGGSPEDLPNVIDDRNEWRGSVRKIRARSMTGWYIYIYIYIYILGVNYELQPNKCFKNMFQFL